MKDIAGFEGLYSVTADGKVWSHPRYYLSGSKRKSLKKTGGNFRKLNLDYYGYVFVSLRKLGKVFTKKAHRLVAEAFIPNPMNKLEVNHKNGIKTDNSVKNLEWVSTQENHAHAISNGLYPIKERDQFGRFINKCN